MLLGYKPSIGGQDAYHYGKAGGADRKFIRVVAGAALPIFDRMLGAVVVVAETYRPSGPASWVALEAAGGGVLVPGPPPRGAPALGVAWEPGGGGGRGVETPWAGLGGLPPRRPSPGR